MRKMTVTASTIEALNSTVAKECTSLSATLEEELRLATGRPGAYASMSSGQLLYVLPDAFVDQAPDNLGTLIGTLGQWEAICASEQPPAARLGNLKLLRQRYTEAIEIVRSTNASMEASMAV